LFFSRFVFFPGVNDKTSALEALSKSDRKAFRSVAAVLQQDEKHAEVGVLGNCMYDMNHVSTETKITKN
jgi:hypothetical protein